MTIRKTKTLTIDLYLRQDFSQDHRLNQPGMGIVVPRNVYLRIAPIKSLSNRNQSKNREKIIVPAKRFQIFKIMTNHKQKCTQKSSGNLNKKMMKIKVS